MMRMNKAVIYFRKIEKVLAEAGASMKDVVRVRMFVTDISRWQEYGKAHAEYFHGYQAMQYDGGNKQIDFSGIPGGN